MAQWGSSSESGILRKNKPKENFDELLVFGYACKLFRDDDKALYIDQGKHLIPWMGDESLKVDRYDCRGALSDLRMYEASREGFDAMRWLGLSDSERKLEELCDTERYYSLHINEEEEEMYKEEEQKRKNTNAIHYSYDVPTKPESSTEEVATVPEQDDEEVYVPPPNLDVPADIEIPKTVKESTRIEKTALFVSKQGPQMEILIKAKQSDNPQFSFLNQSDPLYKFYRHVLNAYKSGRYLPPPSKTEEKSETTTESDSSSHYLHPSLLSSSISHSDNQCSSSKLTIPAVPFKPSANCAYSQLVNRIQGNQNEAVANTDPPKPSVEAPTNYAQMTYEQQQYYQYYYASQYYEYYKQLAHYQQQNSGQSAEKQVTQPPDFNLDPNLQTYLQQMAYNQYMQHQQQSSNNSYAQIVSNVNKDATNPYTAMVPNLPAAVTESNGSRQTTTNDSNNFDRKVTLESVKESNKTGNQSQINAKKSLLSLMEHYGSDTDDDAESEEEEKVSHKRDVYVAPKGEIQTIIDKMANYVAQNGEQFEERVRAKKDPRFLFLDYDHEFNMYYREKIKEYKGVTQEKVVKEERIVTQNNIQSVPKVKEKKVIAPVSFSIKKPKDEPPKEIKSALPMEESDEEEGDKSSNEIATTTATTTITNETTNSNLSDAGSKTSEESENKKNGILLDSDDPILEMIDLTEDLAERRDLRRAEDRIKDKLAAAVREKMASASRDSKTLQLERKRKVEAFLKMKNSANVNEPSTKNNSRSNSVERVNVDQSSAQKQKEQIVQSYSRSRSRSCDENKIRLSGCEKDSSSDHSKTSERRRRHRDKSKSRSCEKRRQHRRDYKDKPRSSHDRHRKHEKYKLDKYDVVNISDSDSDERHSVKKYKKKKSHKRKHESKSKKKSKKRRRRSNSSNSRTSGEDS